MLGQPPADRPLGRPVSGAAAGLVVNISPVLSIEIVVVFDRCGKATSGAVLRRPRGERLGGNRGSEQNAVQAVGNRQAHGQAR
ncbi:hypothetical protein D3C87_1947070 [compost metagenome]